MKTLGKIYNFLVPCSIVILAVLLFQEYQTREIAVCGARLDALELQLRQASLMSELLDDQKSAETLKRARHYHGLAVENYRKRDFELVRVHLHNSMWDLDVATRLLAIRASDLKSGATSNQQPPQTKNNSKP